MRKVTSEPSLPQHLMFSMRTLRTIIERFIRWGFLPVVSVLFRLNISPNTISVLGFSVVMFSVVLFIRGSLLAAGITFLLGSLLDVLDGELARTGGRVTIFGSILDSFLDRLSEGIVLISFAWYFVDRGETVGALITMLGMLSSIATSYVRARAEAVGVSCLVGWITRPERVLIIAMGMIFGQLLLAVSTLFLLTTLTVIQRIAHVRRVSADLDEK